MALVLAGRSKIILRKLFVAVRIINIYVLHYPHFILSLHHWR